MHASALRGCQFPQAEEELLAEPEQTAEPEQIAEAAEGAPDAPAEPAEVDQQEEIEYVIGDMQEPVSFQSENAQEEVEEPAEMVIMKAFCSACTKNLYIGFESDFNINDFIGKTCTNRKCNATLFY